MEAKARQAGLTPNALAVLERRYLQRRGRVVTETPEQLFRRVADAVALPDASYGGTARDVADTSQRFYCRMRALEFLPNSPTLMNAGRANGQLAACFVVPVEDSTESIFDAVKWSAAIQKTGGGTGFSFSRLRPSGDLVQSTGGVASGPVGFMQVFDAATEAVKQGGARRGANMGILRVDHPDILDFISIKLDPSKMRNFNLSVGVTDAFMDAVSSGADYPLVNPRTGEEVRRLAARRVFALIANAAWTSGDPGLVFIDRMNAANPTPALGAIEATNPCGEQPLLPFESCTLGSINLSRFTRPRAGGCDIDWQRLGEATRDGVHFLDNVIDANVYPLESIARATRTTRKIGLGVMGFADLLIDLGVPYDDPRALDIGGEVAAFIERESLRASEELATTRGAFPAIDRADAAVVERPRRNATTTTVAPTGTISIIAGCSSGIEPLYAVAYERHVLDGEVLVEFDAGFRRAAERAGIWTDALRAQLAERGRVRGLDGVPPELQRLFPTAHDLSPEIHVRMQAAFQRHAHAAVSKTINLPESATPDSVSDAYRLAYDLGCKGVTVYRDRSRSAQVLSFGSAAALRVPSIEAVRNCPECDQQVRGGSGCLVCNHCGWSACG